MDGSNDGKLTPLERRSCLCGGSSFVRVCLYTSARGRQRANPPLSYTSRASEFWIHASSNAVSGSAVSMRDRTATMRSWKASLNRFRPTSTTRCIRTDRWLSIFRLRIYSDFGTQPNSDDPALRTPNRRTSVSPPWKILKLFQMAE